VKRLDLIELLHNINDRLVHKIFVLEQWGASYTLNPVLVPQALKDHVVYFRFEDFAWDFVVPVSVNTEVLCFLFVYHFKATITSFSVGFIVLGVSPEAANLDFTSDDSTLGVHHNSDRRVLHHLHSCLSLDIDT